MKILLFKMGKHLKKGNLVFKGAPETVKVFADNKGTAINKNDKSFILDILSISERYSSIFEIKKSDECLYILSTFPWQKF